MSILDNPTAPPAAASEPPAAPLDGIELQPEGAAQHLPNASKQPPNTSPTLQRKLRPQPQRQPRRYPRPPVAKKHRKQHRFWSLSLNSLRKSSGDARLSRGKAAIQMAAPKGRAIALREPSRRN
jgi:hypothetical protein